MPPLVGPWKQRVGGGQLLDGLLQARTQLQPSLLRHFVHVLLTQTQNNRLELAASSTQALLHVDELVAVPT